MRNLREEIMSKNEWLTLLHDGAYHFNFVIDELESFLGYRLKNFDLVIKKRIFDFEDIFYRYDENFYYNSIVGGIVLNCLAKKRNEILELIVLSTSNKDHFNIFTIFKKEIGRFFDRNVQTRFEKQYNAVLEEIKSFNIDDNFYQHVLSFLSSSELILSTSQYEQYKKKIFEELIKIGYSPEFSAEQISQLDESLSQNNLFQLKLRFMDYLYSKNIDDKEITRLYELSEEKFNDFVEGHLLNFIEERKKNNFDGLGNFDSENDTVNEKKKRKLF